VVDDEVRDNKVFKITSVTSAKEHQPNVSDSLPSVFLSLT
jgi:hypothetical protein